MKVVVKWYQNNSSEHPTNKRSANKNQPQFNDITFKLSYCFLVKNDENKKADWHEYKKQKRRIVNQFLLCFHIEKQHYQTDSQYIQLSILLHSYF
jgi:hypothetical protein